MIFTGLTFGSGVLINKYISSDLQNFFVGKSAGIPFFKDASKIVNLEKTFFFLDDDNNFNPSMFHHGR